ncbi:CBS domain-containing protein [Flavobacterium fluviatile]|uniref:CBS domain-containing protein n=1 Tax=Flavobacterium fluviatile TaxID=1862387 RepID=UPI0013D0ED12|nr:CBS domain-containing protein [Flavobacterium fluviatile]
MPKDEFLELVKEIKENEKEFEITPRELLYFFGCEKRTSGNIAYINRFLNDNQLETSPNFVNGWMDGNIVLKHKKKATTKNDVDPIQRIKLLPSSNREPISINRDSSLKEAITLMMMHSYSQLPVLNSPRNVIGYVSWETIGYAVANGCQSKDVKDYINNDVALVSYETPLLEAISTIIEKEFVLVYKSDKTITGIVTIADISFQFLSVTEPFILLEQIENHIRQILNKKFLVADLKELCKIGEVERDIEFIDDLNFGDYIQIVGKQENWDKLNLAIERSHFIKQLDKIRQIRNDVMHFDPEGITQEQREDLIKMAKFLMELRRFN